MEKGTGKRILFAGGGTLGPVTPLLAVAEAWRKIDPSVEFVWVGTPHGPERALVEAAGIPFESLPVLRLTRYPSWEWLRWPVDAARTFVVAMRVLRRTQPHLVATAGGYTGVPLALLAWVRGIPVWAHQPDVRVLLSTKCVAPFSRLITTAWKKTTSVLPPEKTVWIGSPVRERAMANPALLNDEGIVLDPNVPTVLVFGGGGGAQWLNETIGEVQTDLSMQANVVLLTGPKKRLTRVQESSGRIHCVERLVDAMPEALRAAEVVVCRAGMGTIADLAHFEKAAILIPIPGSAQEDNAQELQNAHAAVVLDQARTTPQFLRDQILVLLDDNARRQALGSQLSRVVPTDIAAHLVRLIQTRCFK